MVKVRVCNEKTPAKSSQITGRETVVREDVTDLMFEYTVIGSTGVSVERSLKMYGSRLKICPSAPTPDPE